MDNFKNTYTFKDDKVIALNKILNLLLKRKFDWFNEINIMFLEMTKTNTKVPKLNGIIKVDEDWYGTQWRNYNYSRPIPDTNVEDISIGDIVGGKLADEIAQEIIKGLQIVISPSIRGFQWFNLYVRIKEMKKEGITESIRRILRENDYSPAGKEVTPNKIVVHKSNPMFRDKILQDGLKVKAGECYKIYVGYGTKCKPAIFATNSTNKRAWFDSTYDDDVWEINTEMIPDVKWFKDRHYESRSKHIVTFQDIPREAITLKYEGSGSGDAETWDKNSPNLFESIRRILREESRVKKKIIKLVNQMGLRETAKILGISKSQIVELTDTRINSEIANELLFENMRLKKLKREYEEFKIYPSMDGIFYWEARTNTGHFLPDMEESISVVATPFWDGEEWTPVELDWYTLFDENGKVIAEINSDGSHYRQLKHRTHFNNTKELFDWYEEYYLPTVYDVIMNKILPNVHQFVDDSLDEKMGY